MPNAVEFLRFDNVLFNSVDVLWDPPAEPNGIIQSFYFASLNFSRVFIFCIFSCFFFFSVIHFVVLILFHFLEKRF